MKIAKVLSTAALSVLLLAGCAGNGIVTVNGEAITKGEYDSVYKRVTSSPQFQAMGPEAKDPESFFGLMTRDKITNELIVKKILDQEVAKRSIKVTEEDIKKAKEDITAKVGGAERLKEMMMQNGISEKQLKEDIGNEVKVNKLVEAVSPTKVSEKEIKDFYNKNKKDFNFPERVRASHILIAANPDEVVAKMTDANKGKPADEAKVSAAVKEEMDKKLAKAKEIRAKLVANPKDFAKIAKEVSDDPMSAQKGGDLGFFPREAMVKPFSDAAFSLKPNTVSEIVQTPYGYHIIMVTDRAKAGIAPFEQMAPELKAYLEQTKKIEALQKLFDGLKASAKVVYVDPAFDPQNIQQKIREKAATQMQQQGQNQQPFTPAPAPATQK